MQRLSSEVVIKLKPAVLILLVILAFSQCRKKKLNDDLYQESTDQSLTFYKGKDTLYSAKGGSPHGDFKLKFNDIAKKAFDASGKLPNGAEFENGALIVKEAYKNGALDLYAIMKKEPGSKFAAEGWLWAEYGPDGKTIYNVSSAGESCTSCHSSSPNRDMVRSFDLH